MIIRAAAGPDVRETRLADVGVRDIVAEAFEGRVILLPAMLHMRMAEAHVIGKFLLEVLEQHLAAGHVHKIH